MMRFFMGLLICTAVLSVAAPVTADAQSPTAVCNEAKTWLATGERGRHMAETWAYLAVEWDEMPAEMTAAAQESLAILRTTNPWAWGWQSNIPAADEIGILEFYLARAAELPTCAMQKMHTLVGRLQPRQSELADGFALALAFIQQRADAGDAEAQKLLQYWQ